MSTTIINLNDKNQKVEIYSSFIMPSQTYKERVEGLGGTIDNLTCLLNDYKNNY